MAKSDKKNNGAKVKSSRCLFGSGSLMLPSLRAQIIFWSLSLVGLTLDVWSKRAMFDWLAQKPDNSISVIDGFLRLVMALNDGGAFGFFSGRAYLLAAVSVIALVVLLMVFLLSGNESRMVHVALGLFVAGVCGNLWDRIFNDGHVRDFIDVTYWPGRHWPAFNIADALLCIGVGLLVISSFRSARADR